VKEIKFRVWDKRANQMSLVAKISFGDDGTAQTIMAELAPKGEYYNAIVHGENGVLMQFTGLLDKNGQEIYEGDIVDYLENTSQGWVKRTVAIEDIRYLPDFICSKWQEVIGTVYERPDLLVP
jgi:uncharacterized phage protein (TIGR01671 family)